MFSAADTVAVRGAVPRDAAGLDFNQGASPRFLWLADLGIQVLAFFFAWHLAPILQSVLASYVFRGSFWLSRLALPPPPVPFEVRPLSELVWIPLLMVPVTLLFVQLLGGYERLLQQPRWRVLASSVLAPLVGLSVVALALVAVRAEKTSRVFTFSFALFTAVGLFAYRAALRFYKVRRLRTGRYAKNLLLIAPPSRIDWFVSHFRENVPRERYQLFGYLEPLTASLPRRPSAPDGGTDLPCLGNAAQLGQLLVNHPVHQVIAVEDAGAQSWLKGVIEQCLYFRVALRVVPEPLLASEADGLALLLRNDPLHLPEIVLKPPELDSDTLFLKRIVDILVAGTLLVVLSPLFALIALAIKLTSPNLPVLYPWRVIGYKGHPFTGYKFTTMRADADDLKSGLMHLNEMSGPVFKIKNDPRTTRLGRFLRKYSLNELPQLWSVLTGDMSLVGPRPAFPYELERYELWHKRKLTVRPGITCLWQVRGRNSICSFDEWVRMDLEYIDNRSFWLDLRILAMTVWTVVRGTGS